MNVLFSLSRTVPPNAFYDETKPKLHPSAAKTIYRPSRCHEISSVLFCTVVAWYRTENLPSRTLQVTVGLSKRIYHCTYIRARVNFHIKLSSNAKNEKGFTHLPGGEDVFQLHTPSTITDWQPPLTDTASICIQD